MKVLAILLALCSCKARRDMEHQARPVEAVKDAGAIKDAIKDAPTTAWTQLAELPLTTPLRTVMLPSRPDQPRFDVVGPVILNEIAVVGSSQLGFAGVDWRRGALAWTKSAGSRLAPPVVVDDGFVLIGDCLGSAPNIPEDELLLGCLRSVTAAGEDQAYIAIRGKLREVEEFSHSAGEQHVYAEGERVRWVRGDQAVSIDVMTGVAKPAAIAPPMMSITYKAKQWDVEELDGRLVAHGRPKTEDWHAEHVSGRLLGVVTLPQQGPMIRFAGATDRFGAPEVRLHDLNATGSLTSQVSVTAVPGIAVTAHAISPVGDVALAVRLDRTLKHDFLAGYAANGLLMWVYPLPETTRVDPIGIGIGLDADRAPEAVVAFFDGDTVAILPELSAPPTAPGAVRGPSENTTP